VDLTFEKGRPPGDFFKTLSGVWWVLVTGSQWNQLPERFDKWNSVYRFHNRWAKRGVFRTMVEETVGAAQPDEFKIIDATHIKVHQNTRHTSPPGKGGEADLNTDLQPVPATTRLPSPTTVPQANICQAQNRLRQLEAANHDTSPRVQIQAQQKITNIP
jgi:transposase